MDGFFWFKKFLNYQWQAKTKYYLHSPFVYQFYLHVLEGETNEQLEAITILRGKIRRNYSSVNIEDFGTGSTTSRKVSELEKSVAVPEKYGRMLYRLVRYFNSTSILEIGTSIGISSSYLGLANPQAKIITLEGSQSLADIAKENHQLLGIKNIAIVCGNFSKTLPLQLQSQSNFDLILFDGNHTKEATLDYFRQCVKTAGDNSIFIFDDIYWSAAMNEAWLEIKKDTRITLTFDLYQMGICFFKREKLAKEDFVLRY